MKVTHGTGRGLKAVSCICFLLLAIALLLIDRHSPATGYELSIYDSLPVAVWICLIASLAGGTGIIVHQAFAGRKSRYWLLGFGILILGVSIVLLLPPLRGYYLYSAEDTFAHIQSTEHILAQRHFRPDNKYPITHTLAAQLAHICGLSPIVIVKYIPVLFTVLFMLFSYLLATSVLPKKRQALLAAASTALFFNYYHVCVYPQALSVMVLPLVFYLYFKGFGPASLPFRVAFVIVLFLFPYFHPAPAAVLIACLLTAEGAKAAWRIHRDSTPSRVSVLEDHITLGPTLICAVTFLTWISSFYLFRKTVYNVLNWLMGEVESIPRVIEVEQMFETQGLGLQDQIGLGLKLYGDNLIYLSLSLIALLIVAWRFRHRDGSVKKLSILSLPFLVSGPAWVLIFATTLLVTLGRLLGANIMMWATPVLAAFALHEMFRRWRRAGVIVVTSILLFASILGLSAVYHSPYIFQPSWQITRYDVRGTGWFRGHTDFESRDTFATLGIPLTKAHGLVHIPDHFGHPAEATLGRSFRMDIFLLVGQRFRVSSAHPIVSKTVISNPNLARRGFNQTDFQRLARDSTVGMVYSNGELDVFLIRGEM